MRHPKLGNRSFSFFSLLSLWERRAGEVRATAARFLALLFLLFLLASPALADVHPNTAPGFPADQSFLVGDIDNVNLFNGALTLTIPIGGSYPVNGGFSYGLKLVYNANPWEFVTVTVVFPDGTEVNQKLALPNSCSNAGLGWRISLGRLDPHCQGEELHEALYQDENGTDHIFYPTLHDGDPEDAFVSGVTKVLYTRDGTYLRLKVYNSGLKELEFPDGSLRQFNASGMPELIRDPFGNNLRIDYSIPNQWVLTDSLGRVQRIVFRNDLPEYPQTVDRVELAAFGNTTAVYQFDYTIQSVGRDCPNSDAVDLGNTAIVPLLTSVILPDGSSYHNSVTDYVIDPPTNGLCTPHSGNITGLGLPTLGRLEWSWQTYHFNTSSVSFNQLHLRNSSGVATRTMRDSNGTLLGTWGYVSAITPNFSNQEQTTTVTDPLGHRTVNFFSTSMAPAFTGWSKFDYSLPFTRAQTTNAAPGVDLNLSRQVFNAAGTLLRSEFVLYERDPNPMTAAPSDAPNTNRRVVRSRTVYHDDGGSFAGVVNSNFDGLGHYRQQQTEGSFPGSNVRTHFGNYNPARGTYAVNQGANTGSGFNVFPPGTPWVTETMTFTSDFEVGATAQIDLCYAPNSTAIVRKRVHRLDGAAQSAADLLSVYDLDIVGNVVREKSYGGDSQAVLPTGGADLCSLGLPASPKYEIDHTYAFGSRATSNYLGTSHFVLNQVIDFNTGLVAASTDSADLKTSYEYDLLGRMTWSKPSSGHGGWTQFFYIPASQVVNANVTVRRRDNGSKTAPVLAVNQLFFDSFGRVANEFRTLPDGSSTKRETLYDGAGNKASISEWTTGLATSKTQFLNYDPFGRPGIIRPPDGVAHEVTMAYQGVRQVDRMVKIATTTGGAETASTTTEIYDRHGRLFSVTEPSGSGGANVTTSYGYDVGNRLSSVSTTAFVPGTGNVTQSRAFNYDRAGFLTSEKHPELGTSGNGTTSYPLYDARGHLLRKIDGSNDLTFVYDAAERLTRVQETGGSQRTLKSFTYTDTSNATFTDPVTGFSCTDFRKGKLTQQSRFNYVVVLGTPFKVEMREAMTYCGRDGRLSRRTLENWVNDPVVPNESFVLPNITYDALGNVKSLGYPQCTACTAPAPRTVSYSYTGGLLTAVGIPSDSGFYASGITYHPNLMVNKVIHGNGFTDTYTLDPSSMRRPASIRITSPSGTVGWDTGTYAYDGAGNVKAVGTHTFVYDKVSRLTSANLFLEPTSSTTLRTQTYTFDAFGNLLTIGGSSARNTPTSAATNRLTSGSYDASGNLTNWNGNLYQYDPFHLMWNYRTLSDEWIYLYTADDERAWSYKTDDTTLWTLRGPDAKVLREYTTTNNGTWSVAADYVYRDGSLLAAETPQGIRHFSLDHLGTPRLHALSAPRRTDVWLGPGQGSIPVPADYDGDGKVDLSVYQNGAWNFFNDDGTLRKGIWTGAVAGDVPVPADYDGDGRVDVVIFRGGAWLFFDYATGANTREVWTGPGPAVPVPMDYDGDGRAEFTVYDHGAWHFFNDDGSYLKGIWTGAVAGDTPVPGDYDGDGRDEPVISRGGAWLFYDFNTGTNSHGVWTGANGTLRPVPMDYDGDGRTDFSIYVDGAWHFYNDDGSYLKGLWTGNVAGDIPVPADFNNIGRDLPSIYRNGAWVFFDDAFGTVNYHVYYPFGEEATVFNQDTIREKFTGHERDLGNPGGEGDDLDYMHARYCKPLLGRFLSPDIAPGKPGVPQSWNRYVYTEGNPLKYVDPNGRDTTSTTGGTSFGDPITDWDAELAVSEAMIGLGIAELGFSLLAGPEAAEQGEGFAEEGLAGLGKGLEGASEESEAVGMGAMRRLRYEASDVNTGGKHPPAGSIQPGERYNSPQPANGQEALDHSLSFSANTPDRVGVDTKVSQLVVFRETHPGSGVFHGYAVKWSGLTQKQQSTLIKAGMVNRRGRIQ